MLFYCDWEILLLQRGLQSSEAVDLQFHGIFDLAQVCLQYDFAGWKWYFLAPESKNSTLKPQKKVREVYVRYEKLFKNGIVESFRLEKTPKIIESNR